MKFNLKKEKKYSIFNIEESKLTSAQSPDFKSEIVILSKKKKNLICDLKNVDYVDSSGLSCFLVADRLFKEENLKFILCNVSEKVNNLITLTKLDTILTKIETLPESIDYVLFDDLEKNL